MLRLHRAHRWIAGSAGAVVFGLTTAAVLHPPVVDDIDSAGRLWGLTHQRADIVPISKALAALGDPWVAGAVTAVGALTGAAVIRSLRPVLVGAGLLAVTAAIGTAVKHWVGRLSPSFFSFPAVHAGGQAYPSGHQLLVIVSWGFTAGVIIQLSRRGGIAAWAVMVIASASAGVSYVYGPAHWVTDVVGSIGLGALLLAVCPPALGRRTGEPVGLHARKPGRRALPF